MTKIATLVPSAPPEVSETLVESLERLLSLARAGEINGVAYVGCKALGVGSAKRWVRGWAGEGVNFNFAAISGEFAMLQWEMCAVRASEHEDDAPEIA